MKRRVIFPDPDIWTTPKENPMTTATPAEAADMRRAGVFVKWHCYANPDGVNAALQEALDTKRVAQFVGCVLSTLSAVAAQLLTESGQYAFGEGIATYIDTTLDPDARLPHEWRRAARLIAAHGRDDTTGIATVLQEQDTLTETILALVDVYNSLVPGISTPTGMQIIDGGIRRLTEMEAEGDQ